MGVADQAVGLSASQRSMARIIEREFKRAGFSDAVVAAAIINAIAESALNPNAVGDGGNSVGLFQLHAKGGGHGMSVSQRKDPTQNTRRIIDQARKAPKFMAYVRAGETSIPVLAAKFSTYVERPADKPGAEAYRSALALRYFPSSAVILATPGAVAQAVPWWMWAGTVVFTLTALYAVKTAVTVERKKRRKKESADGGA